MRSLSERLGHKPVLVAGRGDTAHVLSTYGFTRWAATVVSSCKDAQTLRTAGGGASSRCDQGWGRETQATCKLYADNFGTRRLDSSTNQFNDANKCTCAIPSRLSRPQDDSVVTNNRAGS